MTDTSPSTSDDQPPDGSVETAEVAEDPQVVEAYLGEKIILA